MSDSTMELQESGWEELRKEARKIEGDLDVKLSSYAKLGARFTQGGSLSSFIIILPLFVPSDSLHYLMSANPRTLELQFKSIYIVSGNYRFKI